MSVDLSQKVLKAHEAAELLRTTRQSVYELIESGVLSSIRVGRTHRIPTASLLRLLDSGPPLNGEAPSQGGLSGSLGGLDEESTS